MRIQHPRRPSNSRSLGSERGKREDKFDFFLSFGVLLLLFFVQTYSLNIIIFLKRNYFAFLVVMGWCVVIMLRQRSNHADQSTNNRHETRKHGPRSRQKHNHSTQDNLQQQGNAIRTTETSSHHQQTTRMP